MIYIYTQNAKWEVSIPTANFINEFAWIFIFVTEIHKSIRVENKLRVCPQLGAPTKLIIDKAYFCNIRSLD